MIGGRKKLAAGDAVPLHLWGGLTRPNKLDPTAAAFAEYLHGRKAGADVHGCHGAPMMLEAALVRTESPSGHKLAVKLAGSWIALAEVGLGALEAAGLEAVETPRHPLMVARIEAREDARRRQVEAEERQKRERSKFLADLRDKAAARLRAALAARHA